MQNSNEVPNPCTTIGRENKKKDRALERQMVLYELPDKPEELATLPSDPEPSSVQADPSLIAGKFHGEILVHGALPVEITLAERDRRLVVPGDGAADIIP